MNPDGTAVVAARLANGAAEVARFDVATGAILASRPTSSPVSITGTPSGLRFVEEYCLIKPIVPCARFFADAADLSVRVPLPVSSHFSRLRVSPDDCHLILTNLGSFYFAGGAVHVDGVTGQVLAQAFVPLDSSIDVALLPVPLSPAHLAATRAGRTVTLAWDWPAASPLATAHELAVGSAAGLDDLLVMALGPSPSFVAGEVPAGRYYVRVRAVNHAGVSGPSNEIVIDVP